jgi:hypothetical protein
MCVRVCLCMNVCACDGCLVCVVGLNGLGCVRVR